MRGLLHLSTSAHLFINSFSPPEFGPRCTSVLIEYLRASRKRPMKTEATELTLNLTDAHGLLAMLRDEKSRPCDGQGNYSEGVFCRFLRSGGESRMTCMRL